MRSRKAIVSASIAGAGLVLGIAGAVILAFEIRRMDPHSWAPLNTWPSEVLIGVGLVLLVAGGISFAREALTRRMSPATFLSPSEEQRVMEAIESFEKRTSGELRVHLAHRVRGELLEEAKRTFEQIGLTATRERNAVLFYVAVREQKFAVLGDKGIHEKVPPDFWDQVAGRVGQHFAERKFGEGLVEGIGLAGEALAKYFPPRPDDVNELPNQISRE